MLVLLLLLLLLLVYIIPTNHLGYVNGSKKWSADALPLNSTYKHVSSMDWLHAEFGHSRSKSVGVRRSLKELDTQCAGALPPWKRGRDRPLKHSPKMPNWSAVGQTVQALAGKIGPIVSPFFKVTQDH